MFRSLSIISLLSLINSVFPFLLLPILTREVSVAEYGNLIVLETFMAIATPFIQFSIAGVVVEYFKMDRDKFNKYLVNSLILIFPIFIAFEVSLYFTSEFFVEKFGVDEDWLILLPVIILFNVLIQALVMLLQCKKEFRNYGIFLLGPNILTFALTLLFLFNFDLGWQSKLYALFTSFLLFALFSIIMLIKEMRGTILFDRVSILLNLKFTLPILPHTVAAGLYFMADRLFISDLLGNAPVAIYAAGMQLAMIMSVLQNSVSRAWVPFVLEYLGNYEKERKDFRKGYAQLYKYMLVACILVIILGGVVSMFIYFSVDYLLPESYRNAKPLGILLVGGFCLLGFYKIYSPILWFHKKTAALSKVTLFVFVLNLILNSIFIPLYGVYGACYATISSIGFQFICTQFLVLNVAKNHLRKIEYAN